MLIYRNNRINRFKCTFLVLTKLGRKKSFCTKDKDLEMLFQVKNQVDGKIVRGLGGGILSIIQVLSANTTPFLERKR